ncbi:MarR family winged helix-turn-helix transcriptional regulator [Frigoribacterium faeni]|uniref:MarR family transcriptional regulator n=1 Tax=Frigoribacterium faeni TaxID=145483 RepID=A0A7W3JFK4_9MICO|nr:MarR family transcriptional regulator [Frigoribacterium faeni]MBA8811927.1 DNA-binding MarR family transcriptional regulator [Frigoribacterium faeni]BFF12915.1 MarR family transcriptional regulator [Microbacterium flavescens]GEK83777.1 MarR family transcriptional regulator [Frigoribacterium faeni]
MTSFGATPAALAPSELRYLVLAAQREGNRAVADRLAPLGLTPSQAEVVGVLDEFGPLSLKALGELIVCETGSPSRIVDALVRRGLVVRETSPNDRRAVLLTLTADGRALVPGVREVDAGMDLPQGHASAADLTGLVTVLRAYLDGTPSAEVLDRRFGETRRRLDGGRDTR